MVPFFTVVICTYNRANLLRRPLDSLLNQVEQDWEAIIVDDGSTDHTLKLMREFSVQDSRIRFVQQGNNQGLSAARNRGVQLARGRYVTFLDSDDEYAADHLSVRRDLLLEDESIRFLHGGATVIGDPYVIDKDDTGRTIHIDQCVLGGTFFIRRDVFDEIAGFEDVDYAEDTLFFERVTALGVKISETKFPSYIYYRNVPGQMSSNVAS